MSRMVDGCTVSPRKSRKKSACFSKTVTRTPARARSKPSIIPAGPPPTTAHPVVSMAIRYACDGRGGRGGRGGFTHARRFRTGAAEIRVAPVRMRSAGPKDPPRQSRVSKESQKTFSLNVPWNSDLPWIFSMVARMASRDPAWAWMAVFTIGTSIRWLG